MRSSFKVAFVCGIHRLKYACDVYLFAQSNLLRVLNITWNFWKQKHKAFLLIWLFLCENMYMFPFLYLHIWTRGKMRDYTKSSTFPLAQSTSHLFPRLTCLSFIMVDICLLAGTPLLWHSQNEVIKTRYWCWIEGSCINFYLLTMK